MKSDRIYPALVIVLVLLLAGSGILAYVFYRMLTQAPGEGASGEDGGASAEAGASGYPKTKSGSRFFGSAGSVTPGQDGGARKWSLHTPASAPRGFGPSLSGWTPEAAIAFTPAYMGMPLDFGEDCGDYGGEYSLLAEGSDIGAFLAPGSVCLDIYRSDVYVPEATEKIYTIGDVTYDAALLDRSLHLCISLGNLAPDAGGRAWNPLYASTPRAKRSPSSLLEEWHAPFMDEGDHSQEAQRRRATTAPAFESAGVIPDAPSRNSHFHGNNPNKWFSDLPHAANATFIDIRPGVDVSCYVDQNRLEYIYTFWPGVTPVDLEFIYADARDVRAIGGENIAIDYECATLIQHRPFAYTLVDGWPYEVPATYTIRGNSVSIDTRDAGTPVPSPPTNRRAPPKQPIVDSLSFLGGKGDDRGYAVAVDNHGYAYVAGASTSPDFGAGEIRSARNGKDTDAFVSKIRMRDRKVIYTTFLGGRNDDRAFDIAVDAAGNAYVCGETISPDFATITPPPGGVLGRAWDAFVVKLNPSGQIGEFAFRLGGSGDDRAFGIAVDAETNVFVAGTTRSPDFPVTAGSAGGGAPATADSFIVKLSPSGNDIVYAARFGGTGEDNAYGLALDRNGSAVIAGETSSTDLPLQDPIQPRHGGGTWDAFTAIFSADGRRLVMSTYLGGKGEDRALELDVDRAHTVFVTGETASEDFPTKAAVQNRFAGGQWDAFLCRIDPVMHALVFSTFLGGTGDDRGFTVAADTAGRPTFAGTTSSTNLPVVHPLQESFGGGQWDAFVFSLGDTPTDVRCSTYLGGQGDDAIYGLAMEAGHILNLAGATTSSDMEVVQPLQSSHRGANDLLVGRILDGPTRSPDLRMVPAGSMPGGPNYDFYASTFEIDNEQFVIFLNDAEANPDSPLGTNMVFDSSGNVWMSPEQFAERDELFSVHDSRILYDPSYPTGARYSVTPRPAQDGNSYAHHPVVGMSWYGAVKYCNWLTVATGRGAEHRCYREGPRPEDWAPVTCPPEDWQHGVFTSRQRLDWLRFKGYRLPMDNCAVAPTRETVFFRVTTEEFVDFLNDVEANPNSLRGTNVWIDVTGDAYFTPAVRSATGRIFTIDNSLIEYSPSAAVGARFTVLETPDGVSPPYRARPISNVTWPGAMKYCNWLTLIDGIDPKERGYREGPHETDWSPTTVSLENWQNGEFTERELDAWIRLGGFRLPFLSAAITTNFTVLPQPVLTGGTNSWPNPFNEALKMSGWNGSTNTSFGFGRDTVDQRDANFLDNSNLAKHDTTPTGFYDGSDHKGRYLTRTNENLYGVFDLSGNASEWVSDPGNGGSLSDRSYYGGSWRFPLTPLNQRFYVHPYFTENFMGFRVVTTATAENMHIARIPFRLCVCGYGVGPGSGRSEVEGEKEEPEAPKKPGQKPPPGEKFPTVGDPSGLTGKPVPPPPPPPPPGGGGGGGGGGPNVSPGDDGGGGGEQVVICHHPPDDPGNTQTITVSLSSVPGHLAHGDTLGPCP